MFYTLPDDFVLYITYLILAALAFVAFLVCAIYATIGKVIAMALLCIFFLIRANAVAKASGKSNE